MNRSPLPRARAREGFTLIELLAALAITTMLATFAIGGVRFASKVWNVQRDAGEQGQFEAGVARLTDFIAKAESAAGLDETRGIAALLFKGHGQDATFVSLSEGYALRGGLNLVNLQWQAPRPGSGEGGQLLARTAVFRPVGQAAPWSEPVVLLSKASRFAIRYFGVRQIGQAPQWYGDWLGQDRLPFLVEIEFDVELRGRPQSQHLSIALHNGSS